MVARQWYYPYGAVRASVGTLPTDITFTGQRSDATGLYFYNARYYSPLIGRFISADSIVPEAGNPQALNRYMFVYGNPLKYTDPSGHDPCTGIPGTYMPDCGVDGWGLKPQAIRRPIRGLTQDGKAGYAGISTLAAQTGAWWGDNLSAQEAVAITLRFEASIIMYKTRGQWSMPSAAMEAMTRKWNQFCSDGAWSASCYNGFWGYYQPIRDAATSRDKLQNILDANLYNSKLYGDVFIRLAGDVINNPALGGQRADRPSEWVTLFKSNGDTYNRALQLTMGPASTQAFYIYNYPSGNPPPIFLILSPDQQKNLCGGSRCNLTQSR
ncbi:RHS repeat-associated core domain-containing protein [Candidatus Roseilinea sp. NK_OTU-006]|uniref:RHS repeat-associated core domain-containing protein n=1 Tax=Candidatus Roseilinea sp. NK_OTU-006 TaxID=2704250 RepID=UPI002A5A25DD|nr:RHS repeat-associated core domain-containing protein [Candidatus Roseilinea sp. NK_OTU-006]